jgi:predicted glycoside hydrolase/deacetylase ChbG (UPF0249 family)
VRRLIVNADDFGLTAGVNRGIVDAITNGIVTSATLMANASAFDEAVAFAKNHRLSIGCHVVLIDGTPLSHVPSLTQGTLHFRKSLKDFALAALLKKLSAAEIQQEAEAQIRRIHAAGITVTHVDTHKHTHLFPHVLRPVVRAAKACGIRRIRNPFEPSHMRPPASQGLWLRSAGVWAFQVFRKQFLRIMQEEEMLTTDGSAGIVVTGILDVAQLLRIVRALPDGTWELVCHPGHCDDDLRGAGTRLLESRDIELQALTSADTKRALAECMAELISYKDLQEL